MVQANELRIGNWVEIGDFEGNGYHDMYLSPFVKITGFNDGTHVDGNKLICFYEAKSKLQGATIHSGVMNIHSNPIILTEGILLKLGAVLLVELGDGYKRFNLDGIQLSISPKDRDYFMEYVHQIPIRYLHTLQNFVFATKQKELEINL